jgi:hemolysin activation/secretion protein
LPLAATAASAQPIERHLPPAVQPEPQTIVAPNAVPADQDDTPIGPQLRSIVLIGTQDPLVADSQQEIDTSRVARLNDESGRALLRPFVGRPLSRKLIAEIEAAIAGYYRGKGFPFVSLSTPPQTIGSGILQIRVIEFHDEAVTVSGTGEKDARHIRAGVRLQPNGAIDTRALSADLDWLNRYPFRRVEAVFSPGTSLGATDLQLRVTPTKPWEVYAGYVSSGSPSTGWNRYLLGGELGGALGFGSLLSYQFTVSDDFFVHDGKLFGNASHPRYVSHAVRASLPIAPRQEIEFSFDHVEDNQKVDPFAVRQLVDELSAGYRTSLSNIGALPGDLSVGIEAKRERRKTFFAGVNVLDLEVEVDQLYANWSWAESDRHGRSNLDITLHDSPGGIGNHNNSTEFALFSNGRVASDRYAYINLSFTRLTRLADGWGASNSLYVQYSARPLPETEQGGVGGIDLVRGYSLDDGAYDNVIVSRNEIRAPSFTLVGRGTNLHDQLATFLFLDLGYGTSRGLTQDAALASLGIGADYQLGTHLTANVTVARALSGGIETRAGDWRVQGRATLVF